MKLFIGNLSYDSTDLEIQELLEPYAPIIEYTRPLDRDTGRPRGFAFVTLIDAQKGVEAQEALDGKTFAGRQLRVNEAEERDRRPPMRPRFTGGREDITDPNAAPRDDRPTDKHGKKVVYKSI